MSNGVENKSLDGTPFLTSNSRISWSQIFPSSSTTFSVNVYIRHPSSIPSYTSVPLTNGTPPIHTEASSLFTFGARNIAGVYPNTLLFTGLGGNEICVLKAEGI